MFEPLPYKPTSKAVRSELERIWIEQRCYNPHHKTGFLLRTEETLVRGGYWIIASPILVMKRGRYYPNVKLKYKGKGPTYLTEWGKRLYFKQRNKRGLPVLNHSLNV